MTEDGQDRPSPEPFSLLTGLGLGFTLTFLLAAWAGSPTWLALALALVGGVLGEVLYFKFARHLLRGREEPRSRRDR